MTKFKLNSTITHILAIVLGATLCYSFFYIKHNYFKSITSPDPTLLRLTPPNQFIAPLLLANDSKSAFLTNDLYKQVDEYIKSKTNEGTAKNISFYYKDLSTGFWTGVNESEKYAPASLMKVPILITILKQAETDPKLLNKKILFNTKEDKNQNESYAPENKLLQGKYYSVDELLNHMIIYSDNNAAILLLSVISDKKLTSLFTDLELPLPSESTSPGAIDYISARRYSRLFRVLYNVTYLNDDMSTKALELLSKTEFSKGMEIEELKNILKANKFGERTVYDESGKVLYRELHDCGIIYYPQKPYLLCVMTKGHEFTELEKIIQDISRITLNNLNK